MSAGTPPEAWVLALLSLPDVGPSRLAALLERHDASECWQRLCSGAPVVAGSLSPDLVASWRVAARRIEVDRLWTETERAGVVVSGRGQAGYPDRLRDDIEPPHLVFRKGSPIPPGPTVAVVGTRRCTSYGRRVAFELGAALADSGVAVVSGLATGIDAAAHEGALSTAGAAPIGVVGSGLDVVYPRRNAGLWERVAATGTLLSETPLGVAPARWRFPARNRIIAGLADAVVVVESHAKGGSLLTVDEAQLRDVPVGAVPGPITSPATAGSNQLVADGAVPVLGVDDVLLMIGHVAPVRSSAIVGTVADPARDGVSLEEREVLSAIGDTPVLLEQLCLRLGRDPRELAGVVERLVATGGCVRTGPWIERTL